MPVSEGSKVTDDILLTKLINYPENYVDLQRAGADTGFMKGGGTIY